MIDLKDAVKTYSSFMAMFILYKIHPKLADWYLK